MRKLDAAVEAWLLKVLPKAVAYARGLAEQHQDAEDLVQDVICRLLSHREYNLIVDGEKLLFRSITNACINRRARAREVASLDAEFPDGGTLHDLVPSAGQDPPGLAMTGELSAAIDAELHRLPPLQCAAVELKGLDLPLAEIAEILGLTVSNVGVLIHRGRRQLEDRLKPYLEK